MSDTLNNKYIVKNNTSRKIGSILNKNPFNFLDGNLNNSKNLSNKESEKITIEENTPILTTKSNKIILKRKIKS